MEAKRIKTPSPKTCRQLILEMEMLENILAHSRLVCRVALFLTDKLALPDLDRELIRAAALLHDITKTRSFKTHEAHAETGALLLADRGYPEVGRVVGQHVRLEGYVPSPAAPTEAEIVNYADKRVLHDRIAPLQERMSYILKRYGQEDKWRVSILDLWKKTELLEARLFVGLSFNPDDLSRLLDAEGPSQTSGDREFFF